MELKEFVEWCNRSPQRHIQIIGIWADTEEPDFTTKKQWEAFIRRNLRAVKNHEETKPVKISYDLAIEADKKVIREFENELERLKKRAVGKTDQLLRRTGAGYKSV